MLVCVFGDRKMQVSTFDKVDCESLDGEDDAREAWPASYQPAFYTTQNKYKYAITNIHQPIIYNVQIRKYKYTNTSKMMHESEERHGQLHTTAYIYTIVVDFIYSIHFFRFSLGPALCTMLK